MASQITGHAEPRRTTRAFAAAAQRHGTILSWEDIQELTIKNGTMAVLKRRVDLAEHTWENDQR